MQKKKRNKIIIKKTREKTEFIPSSSCIILCPLGKTTPAHLSLGLRLVLFGEPCGVLIGVLRVYAAALSIDIKSAGPSPAFSEAVNNGGGGDAFFFIFNSPCGSVCFPRAPAPAAVGTGREPASLERALLAGAAATLLLPSFLLPSADICREDDGGGEI